MNKTDYLKTAKDSNFKKLTVRSLNALYRITKKLKENNVEFKISQRQNHFEIEIGTSESAKKHKFNRATGSVFIIRQRESFNEIIPSTPKTLPPKRKNNKDLSDR